MTTTTKDEKAPARVYAESILKATTIRYLANSMAGTLTTHGIDADDFGDLITSKEASTHGEKAAMLDAANLLFLKTLFHPKFPRADDVKAAVLPPLLDTGKMDDCIKAGEEGAESRKAIRQTARVGVGMLHELISVYCHELGHRTAAKHFGVDADIAVIVMPEVQHLGDYGYGIALQLRGGRCRVKGELTPEQHAVVNVAGLMGEKLCASFKSMGEEPSLDTEYWINEFARIAALGDPEEAAKKAEPDPTTLHNGSYSDAMAFHEHAKTDAEKTAAILKAGEILFSEWAEIVAEAVFRAIAHLTTMGHIMGMMTTAMDLSEQAACGTYGTVTTACLNAETGEVIA